MLEQVTCPHKEEHQQWVEGRLKREELIITLSSRHRVWSQYSLDLTTSLVAGPTLPTPSTAWTDILYTPCTLVGIV